VKNTSIGYKGAEIKFPEGYVIYHPVSRDKPTSSCAQHAWGMSQDYNKASGTANEFLVYESKGVGIALSICRVPYLIPNRKDFEYKLYLDHYSRDFKFPAGTVFVCDVAKTGPHYIVRNGRDMADSNLCNLVYTLAIPPSTVLAFNGVCRLKDKERMIKDMDSLVTNITIK